MKRWSCSNKGRFQIWQGWDGFTLPIQLLFSDSRIFKRPASCTLVWHTISFCCLLLCVGSFPMHWNRDNLGKISRAFPGSMCISSWGVLSGCLLQTLGLSFHLFGMFRHRSKFTGFYTEMLRSGMQYLAWSQGICFSRSVSWPENWQSFGFWHHPFLHDPSPGGPVCENSANRIDILRQLHGLHSPLSRTGLQDNTFSNW